MAEQSTSPTRQLTPEPTPASSPPASSPPPSALAPAPQRAAQERVASRGATLAESIQGDQPVPPEGSTVIHPPLLQNVAAPQEKDESTAEEHEQATSRTEGQDPSLSGPEKIWVESNLDEPRVALWERDPSHPNGEAFVGPGESVEVAKTSAVVSRLAAGVLKEGGKPA